MRKTSVNTECPVCKVIEGVADKTNIPNTKIKGCIEVERARAVEHDVAHISRHFFAPSELSTKGQSVRLSGLKQNGEVELDGLRVCCPFNRAPEHRPFHVSMSGEVQ